MKFNQNQGSKSLAETKDRAKEAKRRRHFKNGYSYGFAGIHVSAYRTDAFWEGYFAGQDSRFREMELDYFAHQRYLKEVAE